MIDLILELIRKKAGLYVKSIQQEELAVVFPQLLDTKTNEQEIEQLQKEIVLLIKESLLSGKTDRYEKLVRGFNTVAETAMELALVQYIYPEWKEVWEAISDGNLTIENAARICYCDKNPMKSAYKQMTEAYEQLQKWFWFEQDGKTANARKTLIMDERLYSYLQQNDQIKKEYLSIGKRTDRRAEAKDLYIHEKEKEQLLSYIKKTSSKRTYQLIHLQGEAENGKKFLAAYVERELGNEMVLINYDSLKLQDSKIAKKLIWYFYRECFFYHAIPCFYGLSKSNCENQGEMEEFLHLCIYAYGDQVPRVYICTSEEVDLSPSLSFPVYHLYLGMPDRNQRIILWDRFSQEFEMETPLNTEVICAKYKLSAGQIRLAVKYLRQKELSGICVDEKQVGIVCCEILPQPRQGSMKRIYTEYTIDDLKIQPSQKQILYNICSHIWHRHKVFDTWNLQKKYSYGTGVSCLFAGPPGTGKTMAAQIMSSMLELPLYRVDLSQVVDKYIGETEKKLETIFSLAEKSNTILFFDEADAIFGKRSEVKEAKDRYANTEVSYILQRIEEYDGIVILATNLKNNIDEAFIRRIRYVVNFVMPDSVMRYEIWKSCFSKEIPTKDLNFQYLAEQFELSGGTIKNIVLNAVFLAASEDRPVSMRHILDSLRMENLKIKKVMIASDFGEYGYYFEQERKM